MYDFLMLFIFDMGGVVTNTFTMGSLYKEINLSVADFFKIFGDSTRFKILYALDKEKLCVCDISALLKMSTSAVSHQLRVLRDSNLVKTERDGKIIYYSLADEHVKQIIECGMDHILEKGK